MITESTGISIGVILAVVAVAATLAGSFISLIFFLWKDRNSITIALTENKNDTQYIKESVARIENKVDSHNKFAARLCVLEAKSGITPPTG